jgi:hypothetical protein
MRRTTAAAAVIAMIVAALAVQPAAAQPAASAQPKLDLRAMQASLKAQGFAVQANHSDGTMSGAKGWLRKSTGTTFFMNITILMEHTGNPDQGDWTPYVNSWCNAKKSSGAWVAVKCNFRIERLQSNAYSFWDDPSSVGVLNEAGPHNVSCVTQTTKRGVTRGVGSAYYAARLYIWQVRFLDDNCNDIHLTNRYSAGSFVVELNDPTLPHRRFTDPDRTGIHLIG